MSEAVELINDAVYVCAFCGKNGSAGLRVRRNGIVENKPFIVHQQPACSTFNRLEPGEFLEENRIEHARHGREPDGSTKPS